MSVQEGSIFQTADGNLTFEEFGELVSRVWLEAYPSVPMYPFGTASEDIDYPVITWRNAGRLPSGRKKSMTIEEFNDVEGVPRTKKMREFNVLFEVRISAETPKEANQIVIAFIRFMEQYAGSFKRQGIAEVLFEEQTPDTTERVDGRLISYRTIQYRIFEQLISVETGRTIDVAEIYAHIMSEESPATVSKVT
jgi:hypothetical protein